MPLLQSISFHSRRFVTRSRTGHRSMLEIQLSGRGWYTKGLYHTKRNITSAAWRMPGLPECELGRHSYVYVRLEWIR
jgi:hypothetical protein